MILLRHENVGCCHGEHWLPDVAIRSLRPYDHSALGHCWGGRFAKLSPKRCPLDFFAGSQFRRLRRSRRPFSWSRPDATQRLSPGTRVRGSERLRAILSLAQTTMTFSSSSFSLWRKLPSWWLSSFWSRKRHHPNFANTAWWDRSVQSDRS